VSADRNAGLVLGAAVLAAGLVAGLFFFSAIAVMPALTAADDRTLVDAMQQMIDKIENPAFFLAFLGAPALAAVALNEELKEAGDTARIEDLAAVRDDFATPWVAWDIVRTLASVAAFGSLTWALVLLAAPAPGSSTAAEPGPRTYGDGGRGRPTTGEPTRPAPGRAAGGVT
jgi:uncharacterized membrane protein